MRSKNLVKKIIIRDLGICQCCGFSGSEVHHIMPLVNGGKDEPENMILLCSYCHLNAPDIKEEFKEYQKFGGARTLAIKGMVLHIMEKNNMTFNDIWPTARNILCSLKDIEYSNAFDKYGKESINLKINNYKLWREEGLRKY